MSDLLLRSSPPSVPPLRAAIRDATLRDETTAIDAALAGIPLDGAARQRIVAQAAAWVEALRAEGPDDHAVDAFMRQYDLSSDEGIVLMCLAEALLRIPDADTADTLIQDKIGDGDWERHFGQSGSLLVNASTWGLMLTGRLYEEGGLDDFGKVPDSFAGVFAKMVGRLSEPVVRLALKQAMRLFGQQFVLGTSLERAFGRSEAFAAKGYLFSYDMLGEAARTATQAQTYFDAYMAAIGAVRPTVAPEIVAAPGISIKLSSLHPRFEWSKSGRLREELLPRLKALARAAKEAGVGLTIDAEEADRLEPTLDLFQALAVDPGLTDWDGLGLAVQAYQRRALDVCRWLIDLGGRTERRLMVRLVKGAYWDTEIKRAQERGLDSFPVFTRKAATDVSYLACAAQLLGAREAIYPGFATHNAHTVAAVMELAAGRDDYEFQRLHGMGEELYDLLIASDLPVRCRIYAPVGSHEALLPYLMRRLLENGANTSFVNRLAHQDMPVDRVVADPIHRIESLGKAPHPKIRPSAELFEPERRNSRGVDLADPNTVSALKDTLQSESRQQWTAFALVGGQQSGGVAQPVRDPANRRNVIGSVRPASAEDAARAFGLARDAFPDWSRGDPAARAAMLEKAADLFEAALGPFAYLMIREAGKTMGDAVGEVREAVDFLRYYAGAARGLFGTDELPGPTGERNRLRLEGRGVFMCISPWNFPLSIFTGQVAAALAAGNTVLAKPAEQTPLVATEAVRLMHQAGIPADCLHLLPGDGPMLGKAVLARADLGGVAFTGSTEVAWAINRQLAAREAPIVPLIAETGGQNAMIMDSSALAEQAISDIVTSAFQSAGQRCSALRVLFVQEDVAPQIRDMLAGAMAELAVGDPGFLDTDVGPVIDEEARDRLEAHHARMAAEHAVIYRCDLPDACGVGTFFAPAAYEIPSLSVLTGEVFGPCLHVVAYARDRLDDVIAAINATKYGLTLSVHTRIESVARYVAERVRVGNVYVNRNQIGAVVGSQPFGGMGLSGTGPKAGGPHYLTAFATEKVVSTNTAAVGGNTDLMQLDP